MSDWYKNKMKEHFELWQKAIEEGDKKAEKYHMQEHLNYSEAYHSSK